jgi:hypothetical protein
MRPPVLALVTTTALLGSALLLAPSAPAPAADRRPEELADKVKKAIDKGKDYLTGEQSRDGDWERDPAAALRPGGPTALALLALLNAGVPADKEVIKKGIAYLKGVPQKDTYVVGLRTMVYCLAGADKQLIRKDVDWLLDTRQANGWGYGVPKTRADNSNTQYALLGLHEAQQAGIKIDPQVWREVRDYYLKQVGGGYVYIPGERVSFTMTTAGLCALIIAGSDLNTSEETPAGDGSWNRCGEYKENPEIVSALRVMADKFPVGRALDAEPYTYYALYGLERAGRLTGLRYIGKHDWYRSGCEYLVARQQGDGSWKGSGVAGSPIVSTSFALLFLSKGRTPIIVSKLTHGGKGRVDNIPINIPPESDHNDWNNDRNDARHLVEYASRELFKRQPMGWQVFNPRDSGIEDPDQLAAELLQSPVAYFNGHLAPDFNGTEIKMLQKYVENGGLIFAEACCGRQQFHDGFRDLMKQMFPKLDLEQLPDDHPVWTAAGKLAVRPAERRRFPLYGVQMGCKTVVIYSPNDLSCRWESNQYADKGDNEVAFRLGANVIAYATGLEPPKPRLTQVEVPRDEPEGLKVPRGFLKVGELKHEGDAQAARQAMPNLMHELREKSGLDVAIQADEVWPTKAQVLDYKFLYMHGRKSFSLPKEHLDNLRFNLEHGGLLFADACCGSKSFDESFRAFIGDLWPDKKYKLEPIPVTDELYSKELNGAIITSVRCRRDNAGKRDEEPREYEPALEGVKVGGRWAVIYSRWDIGCALEHHKSPDCMGHDYESAVRLGRAAVLYHLR